MGAEVTNFIATVGFPTFVAIYVLVRLETVIKKLDLSVATLTVVVAKMSGVDYAEARRLSGEEYYVQRKDC